MCVCVRVCSDDYSKKLLIGLHENSTCDWSVWIWIFTHDLIFWERFHIIKFGHRMFTNAFQTEMKGKKIEKPCVDGLK